MEINQVAIGNNCTFFVCHSNRSITIHRNMYNCNDLCLYHEWSSWSACPDCSFETVYKKRNRNIDQTLINITCSEIDEERPCDIPKCTCIDGYNCECILSDWSSWSTCSKSCGLGSQTRERNYISKGLNCSYEPLIQNQDCNPECCPGNLNLFIYNIKTYLFFYNLIFIEIFQ